MDHVTRIEPARRERGDLRLLGDLSSARFPHDPPADPAATAAPEDWAPDPQAVNDAVQRVMEELSSNHVTLEFDVDHEAHRVRIAVRAANGDIIREIPPRSLLEALSGRRGLLVDQRA
jgi:uncharacterized FlaG/YvyC family protein